MKRITILIIAIASIHQFSIGQSDGKKGTIRIELHNLEHSNGLILLAMIDNADAYPTKGDQAILTKRYPINSRPLVIELKDIAHGTYAISIVHDENGNGKLDANWIGIPNEGLGASNDAKGVMGPPSFEDAAFTLNFAIKKLDIHVSY